MKGLVNVRGQTFVMADGTFGFNAPVDECMAELGVDGIEKVLGGQVDAVEELTSLEMPRR